MLEAGPTSASREPVGKRRAEALAMGVAAQPEGTKVKAHEQAPPRAPVPPGTS